MSALGNIGVNLSIHLYFHPFGVVDPFARQRIEIVSVLPVLVVRLVKGIDDEVPPRTVQGIRIPVAVDINVVVPASAFVSEIKCTGVIAVRIQRALYRISVTKTFFGGKDAHIGVVCHYRPSGSFKSTISDNSVVSLRKGRKFVRALVAVHFYPVDNAAVIFKQGALVIRRNRMAVGIDENSVEVSPINFFAQLFGQSDVLHEDIFSVRIPRIQIVRPRDIIVVIFVRDRDVCLKSIFLAAAVIRGFAEAKSESETARLPRMQLSRLVDK